MLATAQVALSSSDARRVAVSAQLLSGRRPTSMLGVVEHLGALQMDPTSAVARAEQLVLWSRLGPYPVAELERALFADRTLFQYSAYILPMRDLPVHRALMRRYPSPDTTRGRYELDWLVQNASFRRYVLGELRRRGALRGRELEDRAVVPWRSGGWNDGKNVPMLLELLWARGEVAIVGRDGQERVWDLASRWYPPSARGLSQADVARRLLDRQLQARGIAREDQFGFSVAGRLPSREPALARLLREGAIVPVTVAGLASRRQWYAHTGALARIEAGFEPRTTLLAPFDRLVHDRDRAQALFGFRYRLEMYVPAAKREYGYYVLPILHGDWLIGRLDPWFDTATRRLSIKAVFAEPGAPGTAGPAIADAIRELAAWLGADAIDVGRTRPRQWARALSGL